MGNETASGLFGFLFGAFAIILIVSLSPNSKMEREGYKRGVKHCMEGKAKAEITNDTTVTYQP